MEEAFKEYVINKKINIPFLLNSFLQYNVNSYEGKVYCPFHENYNTPAAKLYNNKDGDTLFCFSERKVYHPVDFFKKNIIKYNIEKLFNNIWNRLSLDERRALEEEFGTYNTDTISPIWYNNKENLNRFKEYKANIGSHIQFLINIIDVIKGEEADV